MNKVANYHGLSTDYNLSSLLPLETYLEIITYPKREIKDLTGLKFHNVIIPSEKDFIRELKSKLGVEIDRYDGRTTKAERSLLAQSRLRASAIEKKLKEWKLIEKTEKYVASADPNIFDSFMDGWYMKKRKRLNFDAYIKKLSKVLRENKQVQLFFACGKFDFQIPCGKQLILTKALTKEHPTRVHAKEYNGGHAILPLVEKNEHDDFHTQIKALYPSSYRHK